METNLSPQLKAIWDRLQDDESKIIFRHRLLYFLDGDTRHIARMLMELEREHPNRTDWKTLSDLIAAYTETPRDIVLYGAGRSTAYSLAMLDASGLAPVCFIDRSPMKQQTSIRGYPVYPPEKLCEYRGAYILVTPTFFRDEIRCELDDYGILRELVFTQNTWNTQYFGEAFLQPVEDEIYVDVGCLDGGTIQSFLEFAGSRYHKIYGMEPEPDNYRVTCNNVGRMGLENVTVVNKGAWSKEDVLLFNRNVSASSIISDKNASGSEIQIPVTTIDQVVGGDAVTLIKMDIEGAELEALKGAQNTIRANHPRLAVCVYHKLADILKIPEYLLHLHEGYRFYLRHHSTNNAETVLYAIP